MQFAPELSSTHYFAGFIEHLLNHDLDPFDYMDKSFCIRIGFVYKMFYFWEDGNKQVYKRVL